MSAKKKSTRKARQTFQANPFSHLKGFAVSEPEKVLKQASPPSGVVVEKENTHRSFDEEMSMLGVRPLEKDEELEQGAIDSEPDREPLDEVADVVPNDADLFLEAMAGMSVAFKDDFDLDEEKREAAPTRMKQLKQGRIKPQATLDLHGAKKAEVIPRLDSFFSNSRHQGLKVLLVITGRGLHSQGGEAILRQEAEQYLRSGTAKTVAEWGRAPRDYGGNGALIVFLKK